MGNESGGQSGSLWWRRTRVAVASLLWGLVISLVLAWGFAGAAGLTRAEPGPLAVEAGEPPVRLFGRTEYLGGIGLRCLDSLKGHTLFTEMIRTGGARRMGRCPEIADHLVVGNARTSGDRPFGVQAWGWPWLAMRSERGMLHAGSTAYRPTSLPGIGYRGAITMPLGVQPPPSNAIYLPLIPYWPGLAGDAVVWGSVLVAVRLGLRVTRRRWRAARGRCVGCGCSLAGLNAEACPECGRPITSLSSPGSRCSGTRPHRACRPTRRR